MDARRELPFKDKLVFAGWTKNHETAKTALNKVPTAGTLITSVVMPSDNVNVYAVWAVDEDGNHIPDYADDMYIVSYAANGGFPAPEPAGIFFADYTKYYLNGQKAELITIEGGAFTHTFDLNRERCSGRLGQERQRRRSRVKRGGA